MKLRLLTGKICDIKAALGFDIIITSSLRTKRLSLKIDTKKHLPVLSLPKFYSTKQAISFVLEHKDWIENNLAKLPETQEFAIGNKIHLFGKEFEIIADSKMRAGARIEDNILYVAPTPELVHKRIITFIKSYAKKELLRLSRVQSQKIGCVVKAVIIKDTKSRWGSCSSLGNINYNWRIALTPDFVFNSIVAHEVSHLIHKNHAPAFYECLSQLCVDYKKADAWLKLYGKELYKYC